MTAMPKPLKARFFFSRKNVSPMTSVMRSSTWATMSVIMTKATMLLMMGFVVCFMTTLPFRGAQASTLDLDYKEQIFKSRFLLGTEIGQLSAPNGSLLGVGAQLGFEYALTAKWGIRLNVAQVFNSDGAGYLYTGLGSFLKYAYTGCFESRESDVTLHGKPLISQKSDLRPTIAFGVGMEQIILNGVKEIYPAPGVSGSAGVYFPAFGTWMNAELRAGLFSINNQLTNAYFVNLSALLTR